MTIADAHRQAALGLLLAEVGRELASGYGQSSDIHDAAVDSVEQRIAALTALEEPPEDVSEFVDASMSEARAKVVTVYDAWSAVESQNPEAEFLYPNEWWKASLQPGVATINRQQAGYYLAAIDAVWGAEG